MRYTPISSTLFADRRKEFAGKMKSGSMAIFYSNDSMQRSGDLFFPYRQNSALYALTGIDQPGTILVLAPDAKKKAAREILFVLPQDLKNKIWNGERLSLKTASKISCIDNVMYISGWDKTMKTLLKSHPSVYLNISDKQSMSSGLIPSHLKSDDIRKQYSKFQLLDPLPLLSELLMIKHPLELDLMKKAISVTGEAFQHVLRQMKPGMREYEVEAEISYILNRNGCQHAFDPIVASGKSACTLHYTSNDKIIKEKSMVLLDFGAEYANMASDLSRTIPASGKFTKEQKAAYVAVLRVLNEVTSFMTEGMTFDLLNKETGKLIESELIGLKILSKKEVRLQNAKSPLWKKYFMHNVSHHLGYDVHDLSDKQVPFKAGMVLTCEPGLYLRELKMGIRLENDILITSGAPENLMAAIPIDPEEIESLMQAAT